MAAIDRPRIYKEFLTPALHRRFVSAAGLLLALCWAEAFLFSTSSHLFWSWFPISATGLKSLLLLGPCLAVFIIRVANIHIGERTSVSSAETFYAKVTGVNGLSGTISTLAWYIWSGWFFGEVYIWSRKPAAGLGWIDPGREDERPRLNENPIFLRSAFVILSLTQAVTHLARDYDRITIATERQSSGEKQASPTNGESPSRLDLNRLFKRLLSRLPQPVQELSRHAGIITRRVAHLVILGLIFLTMPPYFIFLRPVIWRWSFAIGRNFFSQLPSSAPPSGFILPGKLIWQVFTSSILLGYLWEVSNAVFDIYVAQPPLRRSQPLTSEVKDARGVLVQRSKDPNGSLISGLKSKKDVPKSFAFWELNLICSQFDDRRKTIYTEVDRKDGPTWDQICKFCLVEIEAIKNRITFHNAPAEYRDKQQQITLQKKHQEQLIPTPKDAPPGLPKIADRSVKIDTDVFAKSKGDWAHSVGNLAKKVGQSPGAYNTLSPQAKKAIEWSADRVLTKDQQALLSRQHLQKEVTGWTVDVLKSPLGEPFRQTFARRVKAVVFGVPYSNRANIIHAAKTLAKLVVCSLREDAYGQVSKDVPKIIRVFTDVIRETERFVDGLQPSYTDVAFTARHRNVKEVRETMDVLKSGLEEMILAFGEYAGTLGLSKKEVREAREAAARTSIPDMAEVLR